MHMVAKLSTNRVHVPTARCLSTRGQSVHVCVDDQARPWVVQEKDRFKALLSKAGLSISEMKMYVDAEPTLLMHFQAIQDMCRHG